MNKILTFFTRLLALSCCLVAVQSCKQSPVFEYEGDCSVHNKVRFTYEYNLKFADAFKSQVKSVDLYVFNHSNGGFVGRYSCDIDSYLEQNGLEVDLQVGDYDMTVWAWGDKTGRSFDIPQMDPGDPASKLTAYMQRQKELSGDVSDKNLVPLYYGNMASVGVTDEPGEHVIAVIDLMKDTNLVTVVLQHLSGEDVDVSRFRFQITDANGFLAHDNSLVVGSEVITYKPWETKTGKAEYEVMGDGRVINTAVAEFTTSRLMDKDNMRLTIFNDEDKEVLSIPLVDYALMVKGYYPVASNQEYLDRQDDYSFIFFLDEKATWVNSRIIVNSWVIVKNDQELQ